MWVFIPKAPAHRPCTESTYSINEQWVTKVRTKATTSVGVRMSNHNNGHSSYAVTGWVVGSDSGSCWVTWVAMVKLLLVVGISIWGSYLTGFEASSDLLKSLFPYSQLFLLTMSRSAAKCATFLRGCLPFIMMTLSMRSGSECQKNSMCWIWLR